MAVTIKNDTTAPITWRFTTTVKGKIYNKWGCTPVENGTQVTFTGAAYNATVEGGKTVDGGGFCANL